MVYTIITLCSLKTGLKTFKYKVGAEFSKDLNQLYMLEIFAPINGKIN